MHCFQDYQIDFFFRQQWYDPRLRHAYRNTLTVSNAMLDRIWVPDTYFENSKNSYFHEVTVPNKMLKIKPDGTILYNARYIQFLKTLIRYDLIVDVYLELSRTFGFKYAFAINNLKVLVHEEAISSVPL